MQKNYMCLTQKYNLVEQSLIYYYIILPHYGGDAENSPYWEF